MSTIKRQKSWLLVVFWTTMALLVTQVQGVAAVDNELQQNIDDNNDNENNLRQLSSSVRVIAEAFECDEFMDPVEDTTTLRKKGYIIRVCVQPNTPTRRRGIVMRSIDSFTFYKNLGSAVQEAVKNKGDLDGTLSVCIPGQVTCSFKTKLIDAFFYGSTNGTVVGTGEVSMEVADEGKFRSRILQTQVEFRLGGRSGNDNNNDNNRRRAQVGSALNGFAGSGAVKLDFPVEGVDPPKGYDPQAYNGSSSSWWESAPTWLKVLIILGAILVLIMLICLCCMCCWSVREYLAEQAEEDRKRKEFEEVQREEGPDVEILPPAYYSTNTTNNNNNNYKNKNSAWDNYDPEDYTEAPSEHDGSQSAMDAQPNEYDVCFDADEHPGTMAMHDEVRTAVLNNPNTEYQPSIYRQIKKALPGRRFFVCDDEKHPDVWREVHKTELVEILRKEYEDLRAKMTTFPATTETTYPAPKSPVSKPKKVLVID